MAAQEATSFFVSYAREDQPFVRRLFDALQAEGRTVWVDWHAVPALADWRAEVTSAIEAADVFVFVITPSSAGSEVCWLEVEIATTAHKRFAPLVLTDTDAALLPPAVRAPNWIFVRPEIDDFAGGVANLVTAADTDFDWLRLHTRLQVRAREWEHAGRDESVLARGRDLEAATHWLAESTQRTEREVSALQVAFLEASRARETAEAERAKELYARTLARQLAAQAELVRHASVESVRTSVLLAAESVERWPNVEGDRALRRGLALLARRPVKRLEHPQRARTALARDGSFVAVAEGRTVMLLEPSTGAVLARRRTDAEITRIEAAEAVVAADVKHCVYVWPEHASRGRRVQLDAAPQCVAVSGRNVAVVAGEVIKVVTGRAALTLDPQGKVTALSFAANDVALVATVNDGWKGSLRIWRLPSGEAVDRIDLEGVVKAAAFTADGGALAVQAVPTGPWMGPDREYEDVKLLDLWAGWLHGQFKHTELRHDRGVRRLALAPGDEFLATIAEPGTVHVWALNGGRPRGRVTSPTRIRALGLARDGKQVATAHEDGTVRVTDTATGAPLLAIEARPREAAFDAAGRLVVSGDRETVTWSTETGAEVAKVQVGFPAGRLAFDAANRLLVKGSRQPSVIAPNGTVLTIPHEANMFDAAIGPAGVLTVASITIGNGGVTGDHDLRVWDPNDARLVRHVARAPHTTFALHGRLIADAVENTVEIRDVMTDEVLHRLTAADLVINLTFSARGERLAVVTRGDRVRVWDPGSEQTGPERTLPGSCVYAVDPSGRYLATSDRLIDVEHADHELRAHTVELDPRGRFVALLHEREATVEIRALPPEGRLAKLPHDALGAAFSPDGTHVATSGRDGTLRVWELATAIEVARMDHPGKLFSPTFSPDGRLLAASCGDGYAWLWLWRPADIAAQARERAGRGLTAAERATYLLE